MPLFPCVFFIEAYHGLKIRQISNKSELLEIENLYKKIKSDKDSCVFLTDLEISGKDVIACGVSEGKQIGEILNALLEEVTEKRLPNKREALINYVKQII